MNINAKQMNSIHVNHMDTTTALGFFGQIKNILQPETALTTGMATVWSEFLSALGAFDDAYAQVRKWLQTADIERLDTERDASLRAFQGAVKAMTASPNAEKRAKAQYVQHIREKYAIDPNMEYMKESTAIAQMIQEMTKDYQCEVALRNTGLDDWFQDLKQKNTAFLEKMNERTEAQAGQVKGIVRESRLRTEAAYRNVVKLINAFSIVGTPEGVDFTTIIDSLNSEIEHYKRILAQKGKKSGQASGDGGSDSGDSGSGSDSGSDSGSGGSGSGSGNSGSGSGSSGSGDSGGSQDETGGDSGSGEGSAGE